MTLFQIACSEHNFEFVKFLVEHGCDINILDNSGNLPYFYHFDEEIVKYVVSTKQDEPHVDLYGRTFLHFSAFYNSLELIKYFLSLNIDKKDIKDKNGMTPLHYASLRDALDVVKYLISINAEMDAMDFHGKTPLFYASYYNNKDTADYLISLGANITIIDDCYVAPPEILELIS